MAEIGDWEILCENLGVESAQVDKAVINALSNMIDTDATIKNNKDA